MFIEPSRGYGVGGDASMGWRFKVHNSRHQTCEATASTKPTEKRKEDREQRNLMKRAKNANDSDNPLTSTPTLSHPHSYNHSPTNPSHPTSQKPIQFPHRTAISDHPAPHPPYQVDRGTPAVVRNQRCSHPFRGIGLGWLTCSFAGAGNCSADCLVRRVCEWHGKTR